MLTWLLSAAFTLLPVIGTSDDLNLEIAKQVLSQYVICLTSCGTSCVIFITLYYLWETYWPIAFSGSKWTMTNWFCMYVAQFHRFVDHPKYLYNLLILSLAYLTCFELYVTDFEISENFKENLTHIVNITFHGLIYLFIYFNQRYTTGKIRRWVFTIIFCCKAPDFAEDPLAYLPIKDYSHVPVSQNKNVLVSGSTGFVGAQLLEVLQTKSPEITIYVISRSDKEKTFKKISKNAKEYGFNVHFDNVEHVLGDFKKVNLGMTDAAIEDLFSKIGAVYQLAMSTSYTTPVEVMRLHWMSSSIKFVDMCHKTGVQLHWTGGQGVHVLYNNEFQRHHRHFAAPGYFRFKAVQAIVMERYTKKGLYGTNYEIPYCAGPYNNGNPAHPGYHYSLAKYIKVHLLCGWHDFGIYPAIINSEHLASIMVKGVDLYRKGQNNSTHMAMWNWNKTQKDLAILCGCKKMMTQTEFFEKWEDTYDYNFRQYFSTCQYAQKEWGLQYLGGKECCPDWAKEILDQLDGDTYMRAYCDTIDKMEAICPW